MRGSFERCTTSCSVPERLRRRPSYRPRRCRWDAVHGAEVVIAAVPGSQSRHVLAQIGADALAGVVLVDVGNALSDTFELQFPKGSLGAALQGDLPLSRVVKTLNTVSAPLIAAPGMLPQTTVFLSGDEGSAKAIVDGLLADLGWPEASRIDLGDIATTRGPAGPCSKMGGGPASGLAGASNLIVHHARFRRDLGGCRGSCQLPAAR